MRKVLVLIILFISFLIIGRASAYYDCSKYGLSAYSDGSGYCKCMNGYIMGTSFLGGPYCVSGTTYCFDKYGYNSTYDILSDSCKCGYNYVWGTDFLGKKKCVSGDSKCKDDYGQGAKYDSLTGKCKCRSGYIFGKNSSGGTKCIDEDQYCRDKYGYNSSYDNLAGSCECDDGYFWSTGILGGKTCIRGARYCSDKYGVGAEYNSLTDSCGCSYNYEMTQKTYGSGLECVSCFIKYGTHSSYNSLTKKCECDDDYTLGDNGKCVEKQHNVYFILKEVDTSERKAVIQSEYNRKYYLITYGFGCYSFSIKRYNNKKIVVNLGTDYDVDIWDKIVLQDDDEVCEIKSIEKVDSDFTLYPEEEDSYTPYIPLNVIPKVDSIQNVLESEKVAGVKITNNSAVNREKSLLKTIDKKLAERLKGKILLQVESVGEAWYVNPKDSKKYYMANGEEAYNIMRNLGVGITNKDLEKIKSDKNFAKKHSGKIFLQVEDKGRAYYIDFNGEEHYLKNGEEAYNIMRELGLGITNNDIRKIDIN